MNANEMTFGIEIETTIVSRRIPVGNYHGTQQAESLPEGWKAMRDGSIRTTRRREGCEFVSPVLKGAEGVANLMEAMKAIRALGASVNESCGLHIHIGWEGNAAALDRLVTLVANFEKGLFASTGTKRRERAQWTKGVARHGNREVAKRAAETDRYHAINLTNLGRRQQTVEFRIFAGTTNTAKVLGYLQLCLGLVERALTAKRVTNFTAKKPVESSPITRGGEGLTTLNRLFYQLGWTKGRTNHRYGEVTAPGAPSHRVLKDELVRLAKKYDGEQ